MKDEIGGRRGEERGKEGGVDDGWRGLCPRQKLWSGLASAAQHHHPFLLLPPPSIVCFSLGDKWQRGPASFMSEHKCMCDVCERVGLASGDPFEGKSVCSC